MRSRFKKRSSVLVLFLALAVVATACSSDTDPADDPKILTCLLTDLAGVDDRSFNASAWQGVEDAVDAGYAQEDSFFLESNDASDWQPNLDQFFEKGCDDRQSALRC
jgi:basic membrane protein A